MEVKNNPENESTRKIIEHVLSGFAMSTISTFKSIWNNYDVYRDKYYIEMFFKSLREHRENNFLTK